MNAEERHQFCLLISGLQLGNDSSWCFANTTVFCLLWTLACQSSDNVAHWGPHFESLALFLRHSADQTIMLAQTSWFAQLLKCWG